jgi:chromosome segregation ATPase
MSNSSKEMSECIAALATLVTALHKLMDSYPELRPHLLPAVTRLGEALPCFSSLLNIDLGELNERLTEVERRLSLLETEVAYLQRDVAQLKADVAQLKLDVAQLKVDVAQLKADVAQVKVDVTQLKVDVAGMREDIGGFKKWTESADRVYATKDDLNKLTWRLYGAIGTFAAGIYFIARYVH